MKTKKSPGGGGAKKKKEKKIPSVEDLAEERKSVLSRIGG